MVKTKLVFVPLFSLNVTVQIEYKNKNQNQNKKKKVFDAINKVMCKAKLSRKGVQK